MAGFRTGGKPIAGRIEWDRLKLTETIVRNDLEQ
jgi:hypothetical protein